MNYVLKCDKCDRPAAVIKEEKKRIVKGWFQVKNKVVATRCKCGGKVAVMLE